MTKDDTTRVKAPLGANYWKLFSAVSVSNLGDGLTLIAVPWLASAVTRDPVQISLITLASKLPWLLFSLPAGAITDRLDRRRIVAWMDVSRFVVMALFAVAVLAVESDLADPKAVEAGAAGVPPNSGVLLVLLYVTALLMGAAEVLRDNTAQTILPSVVEKNQLEKANGRMWGAETVMNQFVGQPLAGLLLGVGFALPFFVDAGTFAVAAGLIFALSGTFAPKGQSNTGRIAWRAEIGEGFRWLWSNRLLRSLAITLGALNASAAMAMAITVLFAQEVLSLNAASFGLLMTGTAVGAVLGSVLADRVSGRLGPGRSLFASLVGIGGTLALVGLSSSGYVVWVILTVEGFFVVLWNVITVSLRQSIIPDQLLGRVNSVYRFFGWGMISIGSLLGGVVVAVAEPMFGREWALRAPFLLAAVIHVVLFVYALPRINSREIAKAKQASAAESA